MSPPDPNLLARAALASAANHEAAYREGWNAALEAAALRAGAHLCCVLLAPDRYQREVKAAIRALAKEPGDAS